MQSHVHRLGVGEVGASRRAAPQCRAVLYRLEAQGFQVKTLKGLVSAQIFSYGK